VHVSVCCAASQLEAARSSPHSPFLAPGSASSLRGSHTRSNLQQPSAGTDRGSNDENIPQFDVPASPNTSYATVARALFGDTPLDEPEGPALLSSSVDVVSPPPAPMVCEACAVRMLSLTVACFVVVKVDGIALVRLQQEVCLLSQGYRKAGYVWGWCVVACQQNATLRQAISKFLSALKLVRRVSPSYVYPALI
jgi:hypothetical protein